MASRRRRPWFSRLVVLLVLAAASDAACGRGAVDGSATATGSLSHAVQLPPRPSEQRVDAIDPCLVLTGQQQRDLAIDRPPLAFERGPRQETQCAFRNGYTYPYYEYIIGIVTTEGADAWLTERRTVDVRTLEVAGFGAVETRILGDNDFDCMISVDVADGQSLDVSFVSGFDGFTEWELCERARIGAEAAMATLLAR